MSEIVSTGVIEAFCPDGWLNSPVYDVFAEAPETIDRNQICFLKGAVKPDEYFSCPALRINYHGENNILLDSRDMYEDVKDVEIVVEGVKWVGYVGRFNEYLNGVLNVEGKGNISISMCLTNTRCSFSVEDSDVKEILKSIKILEKH